MESTRYPTDLSDDEWLCISPHLPEHTGQGRPRLHDLRAILDAVFYVLKSGCPWRLLPREFPPWKTVYDWFRKWRIDGTWERERRAARASTVPPWQGPSPQRGHRGFSVGKDLGGGRSRARLRSRQECGRKKAPFAGGHRGFGAQSQGTQRQSPRRRWHQAAARVGAGRALAPETSVGRCRLPGERQKVGRGGDGLERRGGTQAPKARTGGGG